MSKRISILASAVLISTLICGCGQTRGGDIGGNNNAAAPTPTPGPPICPTGPMTCVFLTWNASPTAGVNYHIWYGTASGQYTTELNAGSNLYYDVSGLAPGTYYFAATAYDSGGESGYSNEAGATIPLTTLSDIAKRGEQFIQETAVTIPPRL